MGNYNCSLYVLWIATLSMVVLWYAYDSPTSRLYVGYTTTIELQEHYESATSRLYVGYNSTTEEDRLAELAESIHINPPVMATMTEATREQVINEEVELARREVEGAINEYTG